MTAPLLVRPRRFSAWALAVAAAWGLAIGWLDLGASEVQGPLLLLMLGAFAVVAVGGRPAWAVACAESAAFTLLHVIAAVARLAPNGDRPLETLIALVPLLIASYGGAAVAALVERAAIVAPLRASPSPVAGSDSLPWYAGATGSRFLVGASLVGATLIGGGGVYAMLGTAGQRAAWWVATIWQILTLLLWVALAPLLLRSRQHLLTPAGLLRALGAVLGLAAVHAVLMVAATRLLFIPIAPVGAVSLTLMAFAVYLPLDTLITVLLRVIAFAADAERFAERQARQEAEREATLRAEVHGSRLTALRAQLRPHFFLNALNAAVTLSRRGDSASVATLLGQLGDLLRYVLVDHPDLVPLSGELRFVEEYLAVEGMRFGDRLVVSIDASPEARQALVPPLLLQTLAENAIRHGIAPRIAGGEVVIRAWADGDASTDRTLHVTVDDTGKGPAPAASESGVGLANARARLALLFGDRASLTLSLRPAGQGDGGAEAHLVMPLVPADTPRSTPA